jgi:hypothetical protein
MTIEQAVLENLRELPTDKQQEVLAWSSMEKNKRLYEDATERYEQVKLLVKTIKESLNETKTNGNNE